MGYTVDGIGSITELTKPPNKPFYCDIYSCENLLFNYRCPGKCQTLQQQKKKKKKADTVINKMNTEDRMVNNPESV